MFVATRDKSFDAKILVGCILTTVFWIGIFQHPRYALTALTAAAKKISTLLPTMVAFSISMVAYGQNSTVLQTTNNTTTPLRATIRAAGTCSSR